VSQVRYLIKALHVSFTNVEKVAIIYTDLLKRLLAKRQSQSDPRGSQNLSQFHVGEPNDVLY
jgi:hypothetical protein